MEAKFLVSDMTCNHCVQTITSAIKAVDVNAVIDIDLGQHSLKVLGANDIAAIESAVREEGYDIQLAN